MGQLAKIAQGGQLNVPCSGNPFPIRSTASAPPKGGRFPSVRVIEVVVTVVAILVIVVAVVAILVILGLAPSNL